MHADEIDPMEGRNGSASGARSRQVAANDRPQPSRPDAQLQAVSSAPDALDGMQSHNAEQFLRVNSSRVSFREYWWGTSNPLVLIGWLLKLLRLRLPSSTDDPPVKSLMPFRAESRDVSDDVRTDMAPVVSELRNEGFQPPIFHLINDDLHNTRYHFLSLADRSGKTVAHVMRRFWTGVQPPRKRLFTSFITEFSDATFLVTTNAAADMLWPDSIDLQRDVKASPSVLWQKHQERLVMAPGASQPMVMKNPDDVASRLERYHKSLVEFHLRRGVFSETTAAEQQKLLANAQSVNAHQGYEHRDVLVEIAARQNKQSGWIGGVLLLVISMGLFIAIGLGNWSWNSLLMLVLILFIHELGHFIAMKAFGYRNLKMFFIPLFGAAVTGQSYNVQGWKKVIVSLAGPVPGIVLGSILGVAGLMTKHDWMIDYGVMSLIINGLNLFPILPLDGGWVMHTLFFSRHYGFDVAFRVLAALALCLFGILSGDRIMIGLVVAMVMGIPAALRSGRIVQRLRGTHEVRAINNQTVPAQAAGVILDEIQNEFPPKGLSTKIKANLTLSIFESLNSPAPGVGGTLLLAGTHFCSISAAVIFLFVLTLGKHTGFRDLINMAGNAPTTPYVCGSSEVFTKDGIDHPPVAREICVLGNLKDAATAQAAFRELQAEVPADAILRIFGSSLLLAMPAENEAATTQWIANFESKGAKTAVRSDEFGVSFSLIGIAPGEDMARSTESELNLLFSGNFANALLIPPWLSDRPISEDNKKARRTLIVLQRGVSLEELETGEKSEPAEEQPETSDEITEQIQKLSPQILEARRKGQKAVVKELNLKVQELMRQQEQRRLDKIRAAGPDRVDLELIDLYSKQPPYPEEAEAEADDESFQARIEEHREETEAWQKTLADRLGVLDTTVDDEPVNPADVRFGVQSGYVSRAGLILRLDYLTFRREVDGITPLVDWLCSRGFVDLKYSLSFDDDFEFDERE